MTQGSILTLSSYATRTSPVLRGKWVLEKLLGTRAAAAAAGRSGAGGSESGHGRIGAPADGAASRESGLRGLPRPDGPDRLQPGELRCGRPLARRRTATSTWTAGHAAGRQTIPGARGLKHILRSQSGLRAKSDGEDADVRAGARPRNDGRAGGGRDQPAGGRGEITSFRTWFSESSRAALSRCERERREDGHESK